VCVCVCVWCVCVCVVCVCVCGVCVCVCVRHTHTTHIYYTWTCAQFRVLLKFARHSTFASQPLRTLTMLVVWQTRAERDRRLPIGHVAWFWNSRILKDKMRWYFAYMIWGVNRVIFTRPPAPVVSTSQKQRILSIYYLCCIPNTGSFFL